MNHGGRRRFLFLVAFATLISTTLLSAAPLRAADDDKPSWACLPEETVMLLRVPSGADAAEQLAKTRLGALLTNPERIAKVRDALPEEAADFPSKADDALAPYGLKFEDLKQLFEGEAGLALILPDDGDSETVVGIAWIEPGEELAKRLVGAIDRLIDENDDVSESVDRTDIELAGQKVMQFEISPPDADNVYEGPTVLLARRGGRLILCGAAPIPEKGEKPSFDEANEQVKETFARFLAAHEDDSGPKLDYEEAPGLADVLPAGQPLLEFMLDLEPILAIAEERGGKNVEKALGALGLDDLGLMVYRVAYERPILKSGAFFEAASPRSGLLALLDQPQLSGRPPAWMPANIVNFSQISFDLAKAYAMAKQMAIDFGGDEVRTQFDLVEDRVNGALQADVQTLLSSIGTAHTFIGFPARRAEGKTDSASSLQQPSAIVWKTDAEDLWKRILQMGSALAGQELVDEQGFTGIRIDRPELNAGVFVGRGFLVVGLGPNAVETSLSALKNPPGGEASLSGSRLIQRINDLLPPRECLGFSVMDANLHAKELRRIVMTVLDSPLPDDSITPEMLEAIRKVVPDDDELNGVLGVAGNQVLVDDNGVTVKSILELPSN